MLVENYEDRWLPPSFNRQLVREDAKMSKKALERMAREAQQALQGYGLDFTQLDGPVFCFYSMLTATATWTHKRTEQEVELSNIYFDRDTGEISQCGNNYGSLSL